MKNNWYKLYEDDIKRNGGYKRYYEKKIKYRKKFINKIKEYANTKVLEAGCGTGVISINLALNDFCSYAVDCDQKMLDLVKKISMEVGSDIPELVKGDIFKLSEQFGKDEIDVTYSIGVYEHYSDEEIKKLLKNQLLISKYVFVGIPTKYFSDNERLYGNERFLEIKYWRSLFHSDNYQIVEEFSCYNESKFSRLLKYKKWFKLAPIYVFVIKKL